MTDSRFRNRVVGALVLVSLAVIFIPMILTGQGSLDMSYRGPAIPPEPGYKFPDKIIDKPVTAPVVTATPRVTVIEPGTADEKEAEAARSATLAEPEVSIPAPEPEAVPETPEAVAAPARAAPAWAVQVGSFANKTSAFTLRDQLRAKKYAAYVESVPTATGPVYRVRVGPELQQALAETLQARIAKDTGHKGIVVSHR
ncbi:MAG: SPOR domain-containing protein [Gammaproteobacteria bacterium]|nr:SPOR domain-containing protein [Gammaproteobacteria bacterium]